ncbi:MAG: sensor histidine kinase [Eubacteriales bacterium]|nr:sensor histidine kinase [Eubacteriales bacterium]
MKLVEFLKSEIKVLATVFVASFFFAVVFWWGKLSFEMYWLAVQTLGFVLALYLVGQYFAYRKEMTDKEKIMHLQAENMQLKTKLTEQKSDLQAYFLLWLHQMKTPITVSKLILQKDTSPNADELKLQMFYIEEYANMAMSYLRLQDRQADMDITQVNLDKLIKALLKKYSLLFIHKHNSLYYEGISAQVISDAKWLSILIEQILSNALKYTENGSICITYNEKSNCLQIQDTGIGIRSEDIPKIFDRGYSGFNGRWNEKSSGIGLYLVREIASLLQVKIEVQSTLNQGTCFFILFKSNLTKL